MLQSNLALDEWLIDNLTAGGTGEVDYRADYSDDPFKQNVLSHEIKFDITDTGNITPGWKMTKLQVNQSGNFVSATRDRTNDLPIVLGPTIPAPKKVVDKRGRVKTVRTFIPSTDAYTVSLSAQIGLAVSNALKSNLLP